MRTLILAGMALGLGALSQAHAGSYVSLGFGSEASLDGDMSQHFRTEDLSVGRLAVGQRIGPLALEGVLISTGMEGVSSHIRNQTAGTPEFATVSLGLDLKYHMNLLGPIEGYGRIGIHKTWLSTRGDASSALSYDGSGYALGGGLQYSFKPIPTVYGALWLDYGRQNVTLLDEAQPSISGAADMLMIGVTVGSGP